MKIGPIIGLLWIAITIASFAALLIGVRRHGVKGARMALLGPLGAIASAALVIAWIGFMEGAFRNPPTKALVSLVGLLLTGLAGVYVQCAAWRDALREPIPPGHCTKCGYDLKELTKCPECGTDRLGTLDARASVGSLGRTSGVGEGPQDDQKPEDAGSQ
ncbi:MAG: hypothetical protein U0638_10480 [Phycisphaerales bacterium]